MRLKIASIFIALLAACSCGTLNARKLKLIKLPSGKPVKVLALSEVDYPNVDSALMLSYETDVPADDKTALRKEVDEIWGAFQKAVQNADLRAGVIRATHHEGNGSEGNGRSDDFVFVKRDDGQWHYSENDRSGG